ncbi:MAG TPA: hypothetical protein VFF17_02485 [Thermoanaerobaculia bacterium]|nr:hypothetical protein [Thermoanaerobaculia bacterium]
MRAGFFRLFAFALAIAGANASTLEGASSRVALAGGPLAREKPASLLRASQTSVRPLRPGELLVLGPTAGPLSEPPLPAPAVSPAQPAAQGAASVDTVTVRAPASIPEVSPSSSRPPETWETYRTGNVVRISLP